MNEYTLVKHQYDGQNNDPAEMYNTEDHNLTLYILNCNYGPRQFYSIAAG